jgi:hypothetical protein
LVECLNGPGETKDLYCRETPFRITFRSVRFVGSLLAEDLGFALVVGGFGRSYLGVEKDL